MFNKIYSFLVDRPYPIGTVLFLKYRIEKVLGMGSYGITYLCWDEVQNRKCVVKQVKPSIRNKAKGRKSYQYEITMLQKLNETYFPKFYEQFLFEGNLFFTMEHISGPNLEEYIFDHQVKLSEVEAIQLLLQLLNIVESLHVKHIIHRDIRLPNIIVHHDQLKLIDFGLARYIGEDTSNELSSRDSIEKKLRRGTNAGSDFYALGHLLLFLLYTSYEPADSSERSWEEELSIHPSTKQIIRRLLQTTQPYENVEELKYELEHTLRSVCVQNEV